MNSIMYQDLLERDCILGLLSMGLLGAVIQLIALARQVFKIEARSQCANAPLSDFNVQLMTMCLSLLAVYLCYMIQVGFNTDSSLAWIMSFFLDFFSATFELAYIKYSWTRASCVIAGCVNSITLHIITIFVKFCPFILYAQTVPALFDAIAAHYSSLHPYITTASVVEQTLSGLAGMCVLVFDIHLLVGFSLQIRAMNKELNDIGLPESTTRRFEVIVRHGVASCCVWICVVMVYAVSTFVQQFSFEWYLITVFIYILSLGTVIILYFMKLALFELDSKDSRVYVSSTLGDTVEKRV